MAKSKHSKARLRNKRNQKEIAKAILDKRLAETVAVANAARTCTLPPEPVDLSRKRPYPPKYRRERHGKKLKGLNFKILCY